MAFLAAPGVAQGIAAAAPHAVPIAKQGLTTLSIIVGIIFGLFFLTIIIAIIVGAKKKTGRKTK